jgi:hypothetical protein
MELPAGETRGHRHGIGGHRRRTPLAPAVRKPAGFYHVM